MIRTKEADLDPQWFRQWQRQCLRNGMSSYTYSGVVWALIVVK